MLGPGGLELIARLGASDARIVTMSGGQCVLSHDRLTEVISELLRDEATWGELALSPDLIELQKTVNRKVSANENDPSDESALALTRPQRTLILDNQATDKGKSGVKLTERPPRITAYETALKVELPEESRPPFEWAQDSDWFWRDAHLNRRVLM